jgi:hypothetical protein
MSDILIEIMQWGVGSILILLLGGVLFICTCCVGAVVYYIFVNRKALCNELRERR